MRAPRTTRRRRRNPSCASASGQTPPLTPGWRPEAEAERLLHDLVRRGRRVVLSAGNRVVVAFPSARVDQRDLDAVRRHERQLVELLREIPGAVADPLLVRVDWIRAGARLLLDGDPAPGRCRNCDLWATSAQGLCPLCDHAHDVVQAARGVP